MHGLSILHRLLIAFVLVFILVSCALTTTYYFFSRDSIFRYAHEAVLRELKAIKENFKDTTQRTLTQELKMLADNPLLDEYLMSTGSTREINARALERLFLQTIKHVEGVKRIRFVDSRGMEKIIVDEQGRNRTYHSIGVSKLFAEIEQSPPGNIIQSGLSASPKEGYMFSMYVHKTDPDIGEFGGSVIMDYDFENFFAFVRSIEVFGAHCV
jgi:hypothetical protein